MNNEHTTGKRGISFMGYAVLIFVIGLLLSQVGMAMLGGKSPQAPIAQKAYDAAAYNYCITHTALGSAKMNDFVDGFIDASDEDLLRWKQAKEKDCRLSNDF